MYVFKFIINSECFTWSGLGTQDLPLSGCYFSGTSPLWKTCVLQTRNKLPNDIYEFQFVQTHFRTHPHTPPTHSINKVDLEDHAGYKAKLN